MMPSPPMRKPAPTDATTSQSIDTTIIPGLGSPTSPTSVSSSQIIPQAISSNPSIVLRSAPKITPRDSRLLSLAKLDKESWKKARSSQAPEAVSPKGQNALSEQRAGPSPSQSLSSPVTPKLMLTNGFMNEKLATISHTSPTPVTDTVKLHEKTVGQSSLSVFPAIHPLERIRHPSPKAYLDSAVRSSTAIEQTGLVDAIGQLFLHSRNLTESTSTYLENDVVDENIIKASKSRGRMFEFGERGKDALINVSTNFLTSSNSETRQEDARKTATRFVDLMQNFISFQYEGICAQSGNDTNCGPKSHMKRTRSLTATADERSSVRRKLDSENDNLKMNGEHSQNQKSSCLSFPPEYRQSQILSHHPDTPSQSIRAFSLPDGPFHGNILLEIDEQQFSLLRRWTNRHNAFDPSVPCLSCTLTCSPLPNSTLQDKSGEDFLNSLAIEWPQDGGLFITIQNGDDAVRLPIAPPVSLRDCGILDLTSYLGPRTTTSFTSSRDYSKYVFSIRVHAPTRAQLRQFHNASSLLSSTTDAWATILPINRPLSPVMSLSTFSSR